MTAGTTVKIDGQKVELTNLDKVFYPQTGFTKAQVVDYYRRIAPYILPHLEGRPITLKRYPEGVAGEFFYEKTCPAHRPTWVKTSAGQGGIDIDFCLIDSLPSLVWVANLASLEIHALLAKVDDLSCPTTVAFDLDPGPPAALLDCLDIALTMRDMLEGLGLKSFPKTSGGKGLHFFLPLNTDVTYDQTKPFAKTVAQIMEKHYSDRVVSKMAKALRPGKVLIDWSQNTEHKTMACVYSLRARAQPMVSMPVRWEEIEQAVEAKDASRLVFTADRALERVEREGDLFKEVLTLQQELPAGVPKTKIISTASTHVAPPPSGVSESRPGAAGLRGRRALRKYRAKRDFTATPEPAGTKVKLGQGPVFVIQKHTAKRLHYDLRLEVEGVLKSWSVPRGPSSYPAERRLAVQVEDHPLDYQDFEGTIPKGQYGAGQVIVWDRGIYRNITGDPNHPTPMSRAIEDGKVEVFFEGEKIKGGYALIQMQSPRTDKTNWLLIKLKDDYVGSLPEDLEEEGQSVTTGRTIRDLRR
jgi:bifunctional non-homologous end joining protein LigD